MTIHTNVKQTRESPSAVGTVFRVCDFHFHLFVFHFCLRDASVRQPCAHSLLQKDATRYSAKTMAPVWMKAGVFSASVPLDILECEKITQLRRNNQEWMLVFSFNCGRAQGQSCTSCLLRGKGQREYVLFLTPGQRSS